MVLPNNLWLFALWMVLICMIGIVVAYYLYRIYIALRVVSIMLMQLFQSPGSLWGSEDWLYEKADRLKEIVEEDQVAQTLGWFASPLETAMYTFLLWKYLLSKKALLRRFFRRKWHRFRAGRKESRGRTTRQES